MAACGKTTTVLQSNPATRFARRALAKSLRPPLPAAAFARAADAIQGIG